MFGKLLGSIIAAPIRIANIPMKVMDKVIEETTGGDVEYASKPLKVVADAIQESCEEMDE